ncbi:MAG: hypothetical protein KIT73_14050, partial [Burkholderiales bacterium]|nr:hypothetical protein [Burkholderiales bacterium]
MLRVLGCLTVDHDLHLVLLAAAICTFGAIASLVVAGRAGRGERGNLWLALLAVCAGSTVWATHFLAMLAYKTVLPITYDPGLTAASYLAGVLIIGIGFRITLQGRRNPFTAVSGGAVVGAGVTALHYIGMSAMRFPGQLRYDLDLLIASAVLSSALGAAALYVGMCWRHPQARAVSAFLLIAMTVVLHFTGMGAVRLEIGPFNAADTDGLSRSVLAVAVIVAALVILLIGMGGAIVDQRVSRRLAGEAERFRTLADGAL